MPRVTLIGTPQNRVKSEPIQPGALIFTDEHRLYWDSPDRIRYEIADIIELESEAARQAIRQPISKFYFVLSTNTLYRYNNGWKNITGGGGGGGGPEYVLTLDKLVPFASNSMPKPVSDTASPGVDGEYARADHVHASDQSFDNIDCGYFPGVTPPTPSVIHNTAIATHDILIIDGNVNDPGKTDYPDLPSHLADALAHSDIIVDGNYDRGELIAETLSEHSANTNAHLNLKVDGNIKLPNQ